MMYDSFVTFVDKMMAGLEFENCLLDLKRRQFYRNGELTALEPRYYEVLSYLVTHRDRIVAKDELINEVWKTVVSDTALTRCIMKLRKAVGDNPKNPSIIRTVQRSGYHFIADVGDDTAAADLKELLRLQPGFSMAYIKATYPFQLAEHLDYFLEGLNKAGWKQVP